MTTKIHWGMSKNYYNNRYITHIAMDNNCEHKDRGPVYFIRATNRHNQSVLSINIGIHYIHP